MTCYEIVPATVAHAEALAPHMRFHDRIECRAFGYLPLPGLLVSLTTSTEAWTGLADGEPVCMFGVTQQALTDPEAEPWLLSSKEIERHAGAFLRRNRKIIRSWRSRYSSLSGVVYVHNEVSKRWLRWLGFAIGDTAVRIGPDRMFFNKFEMEGLQ